VLRIRLSGGADVSGCIVAPFNGRVEGENPLYHWFFASNEPRSIESYTGLFERWRNRAYNGWTGRYQPEQRTWQGGGNGMSEFEAIMTAYAAETMRRNADTGLGRFTGAMDAFGGRHSFFSSPYLGNIISNDADHAQMEESKAGRVQGFIEEGSPRLFSEESDLLRFFILHGDRGLIDRFNDYAEALDLAAFDSTAGLVDLFSLCVEAEDSYPSKFPKVTEKLDSVYREVRRRIVSIGGMPTIPAEDGSADTLMVLDLARSLMRYGEIRNDALAQGLGVEMALPVLQQMDEEGFLPASFDLSGGEVSPGQVTLAPENVYPVLTTNTFYPRVVSLSEELDTEVRLWTVAQAVGAVREGNTISITLDYSVGETEYVIVRGIPPFDQFTLYGLRWNADRRFQTYGVGGWFYDEERRTLYVKLRHQEKVERLVMTGVGG
jgi:hypothetical protein